VTDNIISDCELGIYLDHDGLYDFTVTGNTVEDSRKGIGLGTLSGATIDDNDVSGCTQIGIEIRGSANITNNTVQNNQVGIWVGSDVEIHSNNIEGNIAYGVQNGGVELLDATYNWWGDEDGPQADPGQIPDGENVSTGDKVSDYVHYNPWLGVPIETYFLLEDLGDEIEALTDEAFKNEKAWAGQQKALLNKVDAVLAQIEAGAYQGAMNKLQNDVKDKIEKRIVEPYRSELIDKVNAVVAILEDLL